MGCEFCELANAVRLYEDDSIVIAIRDHVFTPGQITVLPKEHITILDAVPKDIMEKIAIAVNKVSIAAFEGMGSQGTNVLIQNGLAGGQKRPHFSVDVIPRQENDNVQLDWTPTPLAEDELARIAERIKEGLNPTEEVSEVKEEEGKENYLLKQLERVP